MKTVFRVGLALLKQQHDELVSVDSWGLKRGTWRQEEGSGWGWESEGGGRKEGREGRRNKKAF